MSKQNNLTDFLTDQANAIRAKKHYPFTQKINPQNFAEDIASIKPILEERIVDASRSTLTICPSSDNYDGLSKVIVNAPRMNEKLGVIPTTQTQTIRPDDNAIGLSLVTVQGSSNLVPEKIKDGVNIFGVTGTYGVTSKLNINQTVNTYYASNVVSHTLNANKYVILALKDYPGSITARIRTYDTAGNVLSAHSYYAHDEDTRNLIVFGNSNAIYLPSIYGLVDGPRDGIGKITITIEGITGGSNCQFVETVIIPEVA